MMACAERKHDDRAGLRIWPRMYSTNAPIARWLLVPARRDRRSPWFTDVVGVRRSRFGKEPGARAAGNRWDGSVG